MGRPLTGKTHVDIRRETRSNGDVYVYERVTGYDPKTQKTKTLSTRLLGKILAGSTEMIPTRPKKKRSEVIEAPVQAVRTHVPELPAEITLKPYGDPRNVMISR